MKFKLLKAKQWDLIIDVSKEMQDLHHYVDADDNETNDSNYETLVKNFCAKLLTYKQEIEDKFGENEADDFDYIVGEIEVMGSDSIDGFDDELNNLYDFCDDNNIWLETRRLTK